MPLSQALWSKTFLWSHSRATEWGKGKSEKSQAQKQRTFPLQEFGACRQSVGISWTPLHLAFWSQPLCTGINCDSLPPHPRLSDFLALEHGPKQISKHSFLIFNLFQRAPCCSLSNSNQTVKSNFLLSSNQRTRTPLTPTHPRHDHHGQCKTIFFFNENCRDFCKRRLESGDYRKQDSAKQPGYIVEESFV